MATTAWCFLWAEAEGGAGGVNPLSPIFTLLLPIVLLYFFIVLRPQRQQSQAHKALLENLKKNDRVVTIGGIYGVVTNVQREADEVTIKVDEATNAKLRVTFNAIARVIAEDAPSEKAAKT